MQAVSPLNLLTQHNPQIKIFKTWKLPNRQGIIHFLFLLYIPHNEFHTEQRRFLLKQLAIQQLTLLAAIHLIECGNFLLQLIASQLLLRQLTINGWLAISYSKKWPHSSRCIAASNVSCQIVSYLNKNYLQLSEFWQRSSFFSRQSKIKYNLLSFLILLYISFNRMASEADIDNLCMTLASWHELTIPRPVFSPL